MPVKLTPAVKGLMIAIFVMFLVQQTGDVYLGTSFLKTFALVPSSVVNHFQIWQFFTYPFIHGDVMHMIFNLLLLAFIGGEVEASWSKIRFLKYFFFCSTCAGAVYLLLQAFSGNASASIHMPMAGASAGMYGLLVAYGILFGERQMLFMMLFPMKAKHFVWILAGVEFLTGMYSTGGGYTAIAHLTGMLAGFGYLWGRAFLIVYGGKNKNSKLFSLPKGKNAHLKLIVSNPKETQKPQNPKKPDPSGTDKPKFWN